MKKIITYGTFDLFHIGHLNILKRAKQLGDYLIVAVSSDDFNASKGKKSYNSLEDRIVKSNFKKNENPCTCPSNFPVCVCGNKSKGHVVTRKPILPSEEELEVNSRSKSAKLRVFEKEFNNE